MKGARITWGRLKAALMLMALAYGGLAAAALRASALYIMEAATASFPDNQTLILSSVSPSTTFRVSYPFKDAGVQDTVQLVSDASFRPQPNSWLAGPVATLFGTGQNATAVLLQINGNPALDLQNGTVTFNVSVITDSSAIKFSDGVARLTWHKAANPNQYAKALTVTDVVHPGAYLTNSALFLDIDELAADPAAAPAPAPAVILAAPAVVVSNNNGFGSSIVTNTNTNANGFPAGATVITNNNGGPDGYSSSVTTNGASPVPSTPGQTPAPGTYNMVTVTSDCNGQSSTQYSYVPGMRGVSRVVNSNCG